MRWSRLRQLITDLFDPSLPLDIHCTSHRGEDVSIGRYWIVLDGETVWEVPKRVAPDLVEGRKNTVAREITAILRQYVDTPKEELLSAPFPGDHFGLTAILKAADRRVGKRRLEMLLKESPSALVYEIIQRRLSREE